MADDTENPKGAEERRLLERWAAGDSRAGDQLTLRYFSRVRAYFHRRAPEEHECLVQDTFLRLADAKQRYRGDASVQVFVYSVARNVLREHLSKVARRPDLDPYSTSIGEAYGRRPSSVLVEHEEHNILLDALQDIPSDAQDLLELRYWQGLTGPELRDLFGIPEGTVRGRISSALRLLREKFEDVSQQPRRDFSEDKLERWMRELHPGGATLQRRNHDRQRQS